ncbi:hypothetical protein [Streptomyces violaceus]|uniref:GIY-YIG domain-containing protein n=1 Tax=Streptomyces violaceus TaxID=1936 RepID=A0ABY9U0X1_STRVL|nr:hypothetical protein [Streptomyces janthinus]WND15859.1 hypothetical protein RI060_00010 [Streptomyces janthinus]
MQRLAHPVQPGPGQRARTLAVLDEVLAGLYLVVDADGRLQWLGKAHRGDGVGARLQDHFRHPERARASTRSVRRGGRSVQPSAGGRGR